MPAYKHYLSAMTLQVLALLVWWPKRSLAETLAQQGTPSTLLAVLYAVGLTATFTALRDAGGELELELARGERSPNISMTAPPTLAWCECKALLARCVLWLLMSLPLIVAAASVSAAQPWDVLVNLAALYSLLVLSVLLGRLSWQLLWQRETLHYLVLRFLWCAGLAVPALVAPDGSYVIQSYLQFSDTGAQTPASEPVHGGLLIVTVWHLASAAGIAIGAVLITRETRVPDER